MNQNRPHETRSDLHDLLQALPEPELPQTLWPSMLKRRRAMQRNRRLGFASALTVAIAAAGILYWAPVDSNKEHLPAVVAQPDPASDADDDIRAIDTALQTAYAQGLSDADISPLWRERKRLMSLRKAMKAPRLQKGGQA